MTDVLSPDAIAKLFEAAEDGNLPDGPREQPRSQSIRKIDFARPMMFNLSEQRRFERAHTAYCSDAASRLTNELITPVELEVINSSQLSWSGALSEVPHFALVGVVACAPADSKILMCVEEALVLRMIERLLGGSFTDKPVSRKLTEVDMLLARNVFEWLLAPLSTAWRELLGLELSLVDLESRQECVELIPATEPTLELTIEARDESSSSTISLLVPQVTIKSAGKSLGDSSAEGPDAAEEGTAEAIRAALAPVRLEVRAEAGEIGLTIGEVLGLGEGDVVRLGTAGSACIVAGDRRLHRVRPGLCGRRRAVQIIEPAGSVT
jgi:flagellar motor switch protein FliM